MGRKDGSMHMLVLPVHVQPRSCPVAISQQTPNMPCAPVPVREMFSDQVPDLQHHVGHMHDPGACNGARGSGSGRRISHSNGLVQNLQIHFLLTTDAAPDMHQILAPMGIVHWQSKQLPSNMPQHPHPPEGAYHQGPSA